MKPAHGILMLLTIAAAAPALADIYRWRDASGRMHFSDRENLPPDLEQAKRIEVRPNVVTTRPSRLPAVPRRQYPNASVGVRVPVVRSQKEAPSPTKAAKCHRAKQELARIRSIMRAGYKASQQARLHALELRYMEERQKYCD